MLKDVNDKTAQNVVKFLESRTITAVHAINAVQWLRKNAARLVLVNTKEDGGISIFDTIDSAPVALLEDVQDLELIKGIYLLLREYQCTLKEAECVLEAVYHYLTDEMIL